MLGMSHNTFLLLDAVVTIIGLIVLITRFKLHPFIALIIASAFLGLTAGMPANLIIKSFQDGFGGVLGFVGIILALGTMLGKMMADSGGADQIARTLIRAFGKEKVQWEMMFAAFLVGIPLFFEIGFVLLIPLVFIVARRTGVSIIKIGIPLLAGLYAYSLYPGPCWRLDPGAGVQRFGPRQRRVAADRPFPGCPVAGKGPVGQHPQRVSQ